MKRFRGKAAGNANLQIGFFKNANQEIGVPRRGGGLPTLTVFRMHAIILLDCLVILVSRFTLNTYVEAAHAA
jgi:hypothetical protein